MENRTVLQKTALQVTFVLAMAGLAAFYLYLDYNRFTVVPGQFGIAYEVDRKTGRTWTLRPWGKEVHVEPK